MGAKHILVSCLSVLILFSALAESNPLYSFVALGDSGCDCKEQGQVAEAMKRWYNEHPYDSVHMLGDNIYGTDWVLFIPKKKSCNETLLFKVFDSQYGALAEKGVAFYSVFGNHIGFCKGARREAVRERFGIPEGQGYGAFTPEVEADGVPLITFFALNSNRMTGRNTDPDQLEWIKAEGKRCRSLWKIGMTHHPLYAPGGKHVPRSSYTKPLAAALEAAGLQLLMSGHVHYYARMKPVNGLTQVISGGGGRYLHTPRDNNGIAFAKRAHHFLYVEVHADRLELAAVDASGQVIDRATIAALNP